MSKPFSHPLARGARAWTTTIDGQTRTLLVIVTTLELDKASSHYKTDLVARLSRAAEDHIVKAEGGIDGFILINRPRDWVAAPDEAAPAATKTSKRSRHSARSTSSPRTQESSI